MRQPASTTDWHMRQTQAVPTHCPYCALQCGMYLLPEEGSIKIVPRNFPTNQGGLCQKGWTAAELLASTERLTTPLLRERKDAPLRPATWDTAFDYIVHSIRTLQQCYGREAIAVFGGGGLTNEKAYALGKFARAVLRTPHIDYNGRFCMSSAASAMQLAFGADRGLPFPLEDIPGAQCIVLVGSNIAETMPPLMRYFEEQRRRDGTLIVVDPRATPTAQAATLHLQNTPGSDVALLNGLLHLAIRGQFLDTEFIAARTSGFAQVYRSVAAFWPERVERIAGVPVAQLQLAARLLGEASTAMVLTARGAEQQSKGVDTALACINLVLALGKAGRPFCGYGSLTGQGNGQGGREHGQKADQLPGYRKIDNQQHRAFIAEQWGIAEADLPGTGRSAYQLLDSIGGEDGIRALLVLGSNIAVSAPRAGHIEQRLRALDLLVVADLFLSETAQLADVVLPCLQWAEEEGTLTNLEGRVLLRRRAIDPPPGARSDLELIAELAARLGGGSAFPTAPRDLFLELRQASAGGIADYVGISYERIQREDGVFWPCPHDQHPGTPRMFLERFATSDGRARFHPVDYRPASEEPDQAYPLYLTTGRVMAHYQSGNQTRRVGALRAAQPEAFVEIHPAMAQRFGIGEGALVELRTRRGVALARARLTPTIRLDTVFMPFHWGGSGRANLLTNPALDPTSSMPEFKVCAVRISRYQPLCTIHHTEGRLDNER